MRPKVEPTGVERFFGEGEIIVSKTDCKGVITYANSVFVGISGYSEEELLGQSHNIIRHPDMPRCVFQLLWNTIEAGREIFAYVKNMSKNGDHWVHAHVTPTFDAGGQIVSYYSSHRVPERRCIARSEEIYRLLLAEEQKHSAWHEGMAAATRLLVATLQEARVSYDEFVFSI